MRTLLLISVLMMPTAALAQKTCYSPSDCIGMEHCTSLDDGIVPGRCTTDARIIQKKVVKPAPVPVVKKSSSSAKSSSLASSSMSSSSSSSSGLTEEQQSKLTAAVASMMQSMTSMLNSMKSMLSSLTKSLTCLLGCSK